MTGNSMLHKQYLPLHPSHAVSEECLALVAYWIPPSQHSARMYWYTPLPINYQLSIINYQLLR